MTSETDRKYEVSAHAQRRSLVCMRADQDAKVRVHADEFGKPDLGDSEQPRVISMQNAARLLGGITVRKVELLIGEGAFTSVKIGSRRMVLLKSLDAYVARLVEQAAAEREPVPA